jgi:hypothetical protein
LSEVLQNPWITKEKFEIVKTARKASMPESSNPVLSIPIPIIPEVKEDKKP